MGALYTIYMNTKMHVHMYMYVNVCTYMYMYVHVHVVVHVCFHIIKNAMLARGKIVILFVLMLVVDHVILYVITVIYTQNY